MPCWQNCTIAAGGWASRRPASPDHTHAALELLGGEGPLDGWTTADDAEESKPAPDILRAALDQIGGRAAVCVGDSTYDVKAAAAEGWECIGVRTGGFGAAELYEAGAKQVFDDVAALLVGIDETRLVQPDKG